ncbi:MAG: nucleoside triphosphate pyrophosphohydrolase, partial [Clostridia bacterium]|nr:nucleoside triphosphate pyrophosphohydrolase [Clostridia bacterium]
SKAAKAGFDWTEVSGALDRLSEEIEELKAAIESGNKEDIGDELGDVLFSAVNVSRFVKVDPEEALTQSTDKFVSRFRKVEAKANERGIDMTAASLETLDSLWDEAKKGI